MPTLLTQAWELADQRCARAGLALGRSVHQRLVRSCCPSAALRGTRVLTVLRAAHTWQVWHHMRLEQDARRAAVLELEPAVGSVAAVVRQPHGPQSHVRSCQWHWQRQQQRQWQWQSTGATVLVARWACWHALMRGTRGSIAAYNDISGSIPAQVGNLKALERIDLRHNLLTSMQVPLAQLPSLRWLQLGFNRISATLPSLNLPTQLTQIDLAQVRLSAAN